MAFTQSKVIMCMCLCVKERECVIFRENLNWKPEFSEKGETERGGGGREGERAIERKRGSGEEREKRETRERESSEHCSETCGFWGKFHAEASGKKKLQPEPHMWTLFLFIKKKQFATLERIIER